MQYDWYAYKKRQIWRHTSTQGEHHVRMRAEIHKPRNAQGCSELPEASAGPRTASSPTDLRRTDTDSTCISDVQPPDYMTIIYVV